MNVNDRNTSPIDPNRNTGASQNKELSPVDAQTTKSAGSILEKLGNFFNNKTVWGLLANVTSAKDMKHFQLSENNLLKSFKSGRVTPMSPAQLEESINDKLDINNSTIKDLKNEIGTKQGWIANKTKNASRDAKIMGEDGVIREDPAMLKKTESEIAKTKQEVSQLQKQVDLYNRITELEANINDRKGIVSGLKQKVDENEELIKSSLDGNRAGVAKRDVKRDSETAIRGLKEINNLESEIEKLQAEFIQLRSKNTK